MRKKLKDFCDGSLFQVTDGYIFCDVDGDSKTFDSKQTAEDEYYIKQAWDHLGSAIRDNTRDQRIFMGKKIDNGTWDNEE